MSDNDDIQPKLDALNRARAYNAANTQGRINEGPLLPYAEIDRLRARVAELEGERDAAVRSRETAQNDYARLHGVYRDLDAERDGLFNKARELERERNQALAEALRQQHRAEVAELNERHAYQHREIDQQEIAELKQRIQALATDVQWGKAERERMAVAAQAAEAEAAGLRTWLEEIARDEPNTRTPAQIAGIALRGFRLVNLEEGSNGL